MSGKTMIEWTAMPGFAPAVWNPTTGCTRVSAGCDNCYAFALHDKRFASNLKAAKDAGAHRMNAIAQLTNPGTIIARARVLEVKLPWPKQYDLPFSRVQLLEERLDVPLRTRKPTCYFVDSMADLFHVDVPDAFIDRVFFTMSFATWHTFLVLTKRPERMRAYLEAARPTKRERIPDGWGKAHLRYIDGTDLGKLMAGEIPYTWPAPNVWLGTSVEDQASADERIPHLLATPAAVRFLSCEPLLGPVELDQPKCESCMEFGIPTKPKAGSPTAFCDQCGYEMSWGHWLGPDLIDWVIVGGESGPRARPMALAWARSLQEQCAAAGVAFFMKQLGSNPHATTVAFEKVEEGFAGSWTTVPIKLRESHGRDMDEWPDDLRIRTWPR